MKQLMQDLRELAKGDARLMPMLIRAARLGAERASQLDKDYRQNLIIDLQREECFAQTDRANVVWGRYMRPQRECTCD